MTEADTTDIAVDLDQDLGLAEEDKPTWEEAFQPPPWSAEPAADFSDDVLDPEAYVVLSFGYDDETPIVCAGTKTWPLFREQALILAASLDFYSGARKMVAAFGVASDEVIEGAFGTDVLAGLRDLRKAIAKAEGRS